MNLSARRDTGHRGSVLLRVLVWGVSLVLLLAVLTVVAFQHWARGQYAPAIERFQADVTAQVDLYCEQQALLDKEPWFHEPRSPGDAGPLLNGWLGLAEGAPAQETSPLALPAHLPQKSQDWKDWLTSEVDLSGLDFSWMRQLHAFDHWNTLPSAALPPDEPLDVMSAPVPEFSRLLLWSKLRLRHGLQQGTPLEAARDVRHLAWLAYRTDTLVGGMVAVALLELEQAAHASLATPPPDWRPMSAEQPRRFGAVLWSSAAYSSIATPPVIGQKARACGPSIGHCTGLVEAAWLSRFLEPFATASYRESYASLKAASAAASCATPLLSTIWEHGVTLVDPRARSDVGIELPGAIRLLPERTIEAFIANVLLSSSLMGLDRLRAFEASSPGAVATEAEAGP